LLSFVNRAARRRRAGAAVAALAVGSILAGCSVSIPGRGGSSPVPTPPRAATSAPPSGDPAQQPAFAGFYGQKPAWTGCGGGYECTKVTVPVDWAQPAGATIQLALIRVRATGTRIGSLFVNPGGPGVSGVDWLRQAAQAYGTALRSAFDLVSWDPRGIGASDPIECLPNSALDGFNALDSTPDTPAEQTALVTANRDFATGCTQLTGPILGHVDTLSTVKDMDVMRAAVGDRTLSYFGASYGTFLGAWYAQTFPWRVGRLVLDGAVDPSVDAKGYAEGQTVGFARGLQAYVENCLTQQGCPLRGTPEQAKSQLGELIQGADAQPLRTGQPRELTQSLMVTGIIQGMYSESLWPALNQSLTKAFQGDGSGLLELADQYNERAANGHYAQTEQATGPIFCLDHPENRSVAQIAQDAANLEQRYPPLGSAIGWSALGCVQWPIKPVMTPQRLTAAGAAPILVVGTTGDPATPYEWAQSLAAQLSSGRLLTRVGFGHTAYFEGNGCIDSAVESYLVSGALPAKNTVCR
jgi:pimeloyl-ACP methyl ester carboxylesterase